MFETKTVSELSSNSPANVQLNLLLGLIDWDFKQTKFYFIVNVNLGAFGTRIFSNIFWGKMRTEESKKATSGLIAHFGGLVASV